MTEYAITLSDHLSDPLRRSLDNGIIAKYDDSGRPLFLIRKALVEKVDGFKIEIFSNEHPPPHFRVIYQGMTANFRISDCKVLNGDKKLLKYNNNIKAWWKENKELLIQFWNARRPSDCPVGNYKE